MKLLLTVLFVLIPLTVHAEYLGNLSANEFDPNSIANPFGTGSPYSSNSVTNQFGIYGSPYSNRSASNPYATEAPRLYDQQGNYRGELSTNPYDPDSVSNPYGRYGNPYSPDSLNNPFGAGNPYRSDSPTNPYGQGWHIEGRAGPTTMPPPGQRAPVFLPSPSHTPAIIPFAPWGCAQWDYDMANMNASLQREEMLMHMRMGELMRMQAQEDRDDEAMAVREAQKVRARGSLPLQRLSPEQLHDAMRNHLRGEFQKMGMTVDDNELEELTNFAVAQRRHREARIAELAGLEATTAQGEAARDLKQEQRQRLRREALVLAKQALTDVGLTQPRHLHLLRGEIAERRRQDPDGWDRWVRTTPPAVQFKELAQEVLTIVCSVGAAAGCPTGQ